MVLLDELRVTMSDYRKDLKELYEVLGIEKAQARYDELQKQVADPDFYSDLENSQKVLQEVKSLENRINKYKKMEETLDDILTLIELTMEEGEEESNAELNEEADSFVKELESLKLASLLTGEYDSSNAILTFHAGAGAQRRRTGQKCSTGCTTAGQSATTSRQNCWTIWTATRLA